MPPASSSIGVSINSNIEHGYQKKGEVVNKREDIFLEAIYITLEGETLQVGSSVIFVSHDEHPQPRERAWQNQRGKKTLLSLTLV